jgi:hypothetical protein
MMCCPRTTLYSLQLHHFAAAHINNYMASMATY